MTHSAGLVATGMTAEIDYEVVGISLNEASFEQPTVQMSAGKIDGSVFFRWIYVPHYIVTMIVLIITNIRAPATEVNTPRPKPKNIHAPGGCTDVYVFRLIWCPWRDSNPHAFRHWYLKPACLPIPPQGQL